MVIAPPPPILTERHHGIDALRGSMMLLGVVIHLSINYIEGPEDPVWPFRDPSRTPFAGLVVMAIHTFRMPAFFVLSGYFAAMLLDRRGVGGFVRNRLQRIVLPAVMGWAVLFPLTMLSFAFVRAQSVDGDATAKAVAFGMLLQAAGSWFGPIHLWFLEILILFLALSLPAVALARALPASIRAAAAGVRTALFTGRARWLLVPLLTVLSGIPMLSMDQPGVDTPRSFLITPPILVCYAIYFAAGWCIRREPPMLPRLVRTSWWHLGLGIPVLLAAIVLGIAWFIRADRGTTPAPTLLVAAQATSALASWLLIFGLIGICERMLAHPRPWIRWLVDASFWIYLVHLPLCVIVPWLLRDLPMGALGKLALGFVIVSILLALSYEATLMIVRPRRGS